VNTPSDPFAKLQAASDRHRLDLIKTELALCFTFSTIAARKYETGNQESADRSMANAEKAYETVLQFLSDPKHSTHLTEETIQGSYPKSAISVQWAAVAWRSSDKWLQ
jgi:hypothetical protein